MAPITQIVVIACLLYFANAAPTAETDAKNDKETDEELIQSESKDGKLEIIKRIKKVNADGSYTIGYEADDGSFKIESRDVLGNIKGTYGFVDDEGKIKRVSYTSSNSSEIITKPEPEVSVVQRIPKTDKSKSFISSSVSPIAYSSTTPSTASSTDNVIQSIPRRRTASTSTTQKPNYKDVINVSSSTGSRTTKPNTIIYTSAAPRVLLQKPSVTAPTSKIPHFPSPKYDSESTRLEIKTTRKPYAGDHFEDLKPVNEEPEESSNVLRRQLPEDRRQDFDTDQHIFRLQQSGGADIPDVYNAGVTPRPLFTTTRPRLIPLISSTTASPVAVPRPSLPVPKYSNYQRNILQEENSTPEYTQQTSTTEEPSVPVVQIPPNTAGTQEPLVAIRHPFQRGAILVPLSQLRGKIIPIEDMNEVHHVRTNYDQPEGPPRTTVEIEQQKVRRLPPSPQMRPLPVQVDENGYVREVAPRNMPVAIPIPIPVPVAPTPKYIDEEIEENAVEQIDPPVSTREFQKLLQMLIARQKRLEKVNKLMSDPALRELVYQQQHALYRPVPQATNPQYYIQRFNPQEADHHRLPVRQYMSVARPQEQYQPRHPQYLQQQYKEYQQQNFAPTRRVARLFSTGQNNLDGNDEYLPPDVREMLLLRMLQLALNPALPVEAESLENTDATATSSQYKRSSVRNVEILGEEDSESEQEEVRTRARTKRNRDEDMEMVN